MKVLYLDHAPIVGGAEVVLLNLIAALDRGRYTPIVATGEHAELRHALAQAHVEALGVPFGRLNRAGPALAVHLAQTVRAVVRIIRERGIDLVHTNTVRAHIAGSLAAAETGTPLVWTLHDNTLPPVWVRLLAPLPRRAICVSRWLRDLYAPLGLGARAAVVHNGLAPQAPPEDGGALRRELGVGAAAPLVLHVGRLVAGKAPHLFVEAAQRVAQARPEARFALVGGADPVEPGQAPPAYTAQLAAALQQSGLGERLIVTGHRADVARFYAAADLLVYTSVQPEGLPTVLLEAMRAALPVVATATGGAAEIVEPGVTGTLVPVGDVPALAAAITAMLADPARARRLGTNGRERQRRDFSLARQAAQTMGVYEQAAGAGHDSG